MSAADYAIFVRDLPLVRAMRHAPRCARGTPRAAVQDCTEAEVLLHFNTLFALREPEEARSGPQVVHALQHKSASKRYIPVRKKTVGPSGGCVSSRRAVCLEVRALFRFRRDIYARH